MELVQVITPAADATWTEIDLSGYGVQEGDMVDMEFRQPYEAANYVGCRTLGSGLARLALLQSVYGPFAQNYPQTTMAVQAGVGGVIEVYEQDDSEVVTTLFGYERLSTS